MFDEYFSNLIDDDAEFMPLMPVEEIDEKENEALKTSLPILPLRNTVLFPGVVIPITIGRDKSLKALKAALKADKHIGVLSQKELEVEDPETDDLNKVGTVARILKESQNA